MSEPGYRFTRVKAGDAATLQLEGRFTFAGASKLWRSLSRQVGGARRGQRFDFDLSKVAEADAGSVALLVRLRDDLERKGAQAAFVGASEQVQALIDLYRGDGKLPPRRRRERALPMLEQVGASTLAVFDEFKQVFAFVWQSLAASVGVVRAPGTANWRDVPHFMERTGADAVPIVSMINLLVGFVMGYQSAVQLKQFGANIYVADLVSLSLCRELGPLMTAIILCGRSGASFTAELGSMKVSEEIDALRTLGFDPMRFLVLPRAVALLLVAPMLTLLADLMGVFGGLVVAVLSLDLTPRAYLTEVQESVRLWDVGSGLLKSAVFAVVITLISCQQGLSTTGGAQGVGRRTTSSVVSILFSLIIVDAIATVFFHAFDK